MAALRYVVLHHTGWGEDHFDLLLETAADAPLASWRLSAWPPTQKMTIDINAAHRRAYLDYEGPVSSNRGWVGRVASGTYLPRPAAGDVLSIWLIEIELELQLPSKNLI